jgi:endonuclease/exonuclease/phosphatase family metal-dependent hydrolase
MLTTFRDVLIYTHTMMNKKSITLIVFYLLFFVAQAQVVRMATYNMRYDNKGDSLNPWKDRLPVIVQMIQFHDFDVFGGQELLDNQVKGLQEKLTDYEYQGVGRDDGATQGEYSPVFYKKAKYKLLKKGTFWLSETPEKPSKGWDAALPRVCSWVLLEERAGGRKFYVFNTHFDHRGEQARKQSALLILEQVKKMAGDTPVILCGDFNFDQNHESYTLIKSSPEFKDTYDLARIRMTHNGTFNSFNIASTTDRRIDHIFVTRDFEVKRYGILTDSYNGKFPSDHFPVMVELVVKK